MQSKCLSCGAILPEGAKLCTNCGKIVSKNFRPAQEQAAARKPSPTVQTDARIFEHKPIPTAVIEKVTAQDIEDDIREKRPVREHEHPRRPEEAPRRASKAKQKKPAADPKIKMIIGVIIVAVVVTVSFLTIIRALRIREIKNTTISIETSAKLSFDNFGDAADNFFEQPDWEYSFLTNTVTVSGENKGTEYELVFKPNDEQVVSKVIVGDKEYEDKTQIDIIILRMFM